MRIYFSTYCFVPGLPGRYNCGTSCLYTAVMWFCSTWSFVAPSCCFSLILCGLYFFFKIFTSRCASRMIHVSCDDNDTSPTPHIFKSCNVFFSIKLIVLGTHFSNCFFFLFFFSCISAIVRLWNVCAHYGRQKFVTILYWCWYCGLGE